MWKKNNTRILITITLGICLYSHGIVLGSGYMVPEQGGKAIGMAGAFVAIADDPSAVFFNPAGLAKQKGTRLYINDSNSFIYYGKYNRVRSKLKRVPSIKVVSTHLHRDLRLEDFGFVLQTDNGLRFRLQFFDGKQTYELFRRSGGLFIQGDRGSGYSLEPGNYLEKTIDRKIRTVFDVLRNFDEIARIINSKTREGIEDSNFNGANLPKDYLYIYYPL